MSSEPPDGTPAISMPVHHGPSDGLSTRLHPSPQASRACLVVTGELDIATAGGLQAVLADLALHGYRHVEVDLSGVRFCDIHGLRALLAGRARFRSLGGGLDIHHPCSSMRRIRGALGLDETFEDPVRPL